MQAPHTGVRAPDDAEARRSLVPTNHRTSPDRRFRGTDALFIFRPIEKNPHRSNLLAAQSLLYLSHQFTLLFRRGVKYSWPRRKQQRRSRQKRQPRRRRSSCALRRRRSRRLLASPLPRSRSTKTPDYPTQNSHPVPVLFCRRSSIDSLPRASSDHTASRRRLLPCTIVSNRHLPIESELPCLVESRRATVPMERTGRSPMLNRQADKVLDSPCEESYRCSEGWSEGHELPPERPKAKKRGGDGHITSPTSDRRVKTLGDQESSKEILARTGQRKHDRKILNFYMYYQCLMSILPHFLGLTAKNPPGPAPPIQSWIGSRIRRRNREKSDQCDRVRSRIAAQRSPGSRRSA